jgi:HEAT repeat protein
MIPPLECSLGCRIWFARRWARSMAPDPDVWLRRLSEIESLAKRGEDAAAQLVNLWLEYAEIENRWTDVIALAGDLGLNERPPLPVATQVRTAAWEALVALGPAATPAVKSRFEAAPRGSAERLTMAGVLAFIGDPTFEQLIEILREEQFGPDAVRSEAVPSDRVDISEVSEEARPIALERILAELHRCWLYARERLSRTGTVLPPAAVEPCDLVAVLSDERPFMRLYATELVAERRDRRAVPGLRKLLNDPLEVVREVAKRALAAIESEPSGTD